ncbi:MULTISPECIES: hypothetical protein [unclassified Mesorhizobium]|uniref:hypothetical protein n=1 Tax=unclassified Mesorhizobium TaxID=325217 RepID=UPI001CCA866F|nr:MULTISPECIES: hypothetical protein [unclassified Mesorhizobium]MBZ9739691.1 hypothetical protein [Mesorhizobium sp. CO1-1-4]MBZ9805045.1 hypothetical protein [Mesorhizobium sp. ES1-6]
MNVRNSTSRQVSVAAIVKRQIGSKAVKRYTATLPIFHVDETIPNRFKELLERLEHAEASLHEEPPRWHSDGLALQSL